MKYALAFLFVTAGLVYLALRHSGFALLLLWPAASFALVSLGYALLGPGVMGKDALGNYRWWARVPMLPFRLFTLGGWYFGRLLARGRPAHCEIAPGVWLGRRVVDADELPAGTTLVIDLTSELTEPRGVRDGRRYVCVPALDASVPDVAPCRAVIDQIATNGTGVYIHCAQGFGRSAAVAAAVLIARGDCRDVDEAERRLAALRPGVRLNRRQRDFVRRLTQKT
jgi:hypothetical protein